MRRRVAPHQSANRSSTARAARRAFIPAVLMAALSLGACSEQITKHGHLFRETDIAQVQPGMGQEQVKLILGTPTTTTTSGNGSVYYYISSTEKRVAFMSGNEVDRQVLAIYFTPTQTVERVANYGLKDGKVFDFVSRTTPAPGGKEDGIVKQLFRNLGTKQIFGE
ncbi:outer membrane protein assembly factor BamE [Hyphomicrobium sp.]|uniref:outer membrane protein assembly factor BamE n=1 Tax=Hyphomicrobium sp. TaxID=82 RepID=UPI002E341897|nr:outer membrane protein assembly factor BamE [Hyphomicrobium sp.]HEX2839908.1 outer membrane protein assembly factor BamE [Hyphomicrobium sp.]